MDFQVQFQQVEALIVRGEFAAAKKVILGVLAVDQQNAAAWYLVSRCLVNDPPLARAEALRRVLLCDPHHALAKAEFEAMDGLELLQPPSLMKKKVASKSPPLPLLLLMAGMVSVFWVLLLGHQVLAAEVRQTVATVAPNSLILTATALSQQLTATSVALVQQAGQTTQTVALTQTATLQGALAATVMAQQTAIQVSNNLPGTILAQGDNRFNIVHSKLKFVSFPDKMVSSVSPDGKRMAYSDAQRRVHFAALDGSNDVVLANPAVADVFAWSPDGLKILTAIPGQGLGVVNVLDGTLKLLMPATLTASQINWSPNSQFISFNGEANVPGQALTHALYVADTQGAVGNAKAITPVDVQGQAATAAFMNFMQPQWFPDGQRLIYLATPTTGKFDTRPWVVQAVTADGRTPQTLFTIPRTEFATGFEFRLSPDGKAILYGGGNTHGKFSLFWAKLGEPNGHRLLEAESFSDTLPSWSPDSKLVAGIAKLNGQLAQAYWIKLGEHPTLQLLNPEHPQTYSPIVWSPNSQYFATCYFSAVEQKGALVLVQVDLDVVTPLVDQAVCPSQWLP